MSTEKRESNEPESIEIRCYFVRERNALVARGQFSDLYMDYYLHLMENKLKNEQAYDQNLKDGFAALALHLASRPWNEAIAWTLSWQDPPQNYFFTGSNRDATITGRVFTEDIRERDTNLLFSQTTVGGQPGRQSMIEVASLDLLKIGEHYYEQSEQRPGRYFRHEEEDIVLVTAQPDCDMEWFGNLDEDKIRALDTDEELSLLEKRHFRFECGCSQEKLLPIFANMSAESLEDAFAGTETIPTGCPRCGAKYVITRETLEAFQNDQS